MGCRFLRNRRPEAANLSSVSSPSGSFSLENRLWCLLGGRLASTLHGGLTSAGRDSDSPIGPGSPAVRLRTSSFVSWPALIVRSDRDFAGAGADRLVPLNASPGSTERGEANPINSLAVPSANSTQIEIRPPIAE